MAVGPLLLTIGTLLLLAFPDTDRDPIAFLDAVAAMVTRYELAALLTVLGLLLLAWGLIGVAHLLRGQRVTLGQVGAALLFVSAFLGNSYAFEVVIGVTASSDLDREQVRSILGEAGSSAWLDLVRAATLGSVLGLLLLAAGLVLRRATGLWVPAMLAVSAIVRTVIGETGIDLSERVLAVIDMVAFTVPAVGLALALLRLSDEQWARWIPLEEPLRVPAAVATTGATTSSSAAPPAPTRSGHTQL
jgi:hypothetical protein